LDEGEIVPLTAYPFGFKGRTGEHVRIRIVGEREPADAHSLSAHLSAHPRAEKRIRRVEGQR
jgi:hypothetical protein